MMPQRVSFRLVPWWVGALAVACLGKLDERTLSPAQAGAGGVVEAGMGGSGNGGASAGSCAQMLKACGNLCVDAQSDNAHCGNCTTVCSNGSSCLNGQCSCSGGVTFCDSGCVDTQTNSENCGSCGHRCAEGQACSGGECACAQNLAFCSSACVDTRSSSAHCGTCGHACGASQVCSSGQCADGCKPTETQCGNDCADTNSSPTHCGNCTTACTGIDVCVSGQCQCPDELSKCGSQCVNTLTDSAHCGDCITACSGGKSCLGGSCTCPDAQTDCSGTCRLLSTDSANCGTCGKACASGQTCKAGSCACPAGQTLQNGTCSSTGGSGGSGGTGGSAGTGGASGGTTTGGKNSGGTNSGGTNTGGTNTGGKSTGGTSTGGKSTGGTSTGGTGTGGTGTGGKSTGGTNTGGTSTGGKSTGGTSTGGTATGGTSTGGTTGSTGCNKARGVADGSNTIVVAGATRSYVLRTPAAYDSTRPYRLVLAFHEINTTAQQIADGSVATSPTPFYGLWDLSQNSTIFVAMNGSTGGPWPNTNAQDLSFTDAVLAQLQAGLCIDKTKIFANGFSAGAGMVYALACARANVFRGVALYSGGQFSGCSGGTTPIAFFSSHGVNDSIIGPSNGTALRDHFVSVNTCTSQSPTAPPVGGHACTTYSGCSSGHPVEWCAFSGDHTTRPLDSGQTTSWLPARVWAFFSQF